MSEAQQPVFSIEKVYVKDLSLEVPNAPHCFLEREGHQVEIGLGTSANAVGDGVFDVALTVTVTAKIGEKTMFLVEVVQAGIFQIQGVPDENIEPILAVACPNILFPYAREAVSDAVSRAGFPPVLLSPVNFESLYQQKLASDQEAAQAAGGPHEISIQ